MLKKLWPLILAFSFAATKANAVVIEGFTPSGQFVTVGVSDDGRLLISVSTGVAQTVTFASTQPVTAFQGTTPWIIQSTVAVSVVPLGSFSVTPTSATINVTTQVNVTSAGQTLCAASTTRLGCFFCNQSASIHVFWGTTGATT